MRPTLLLCSPAMYFGLMGEGQPWGRYDDMWAGWCVKVICDHLGLGVKTGKPYIWHSKARGCCRPAAALGGGCPSAAATADACLLQPQLAHACVLGPSGALRRASPAPGTPNARPP